MKTKKLLSLLLALMMILSVVPMYASAATQIALKATHVTEWPTAEGEIYYGEPLSKINLVGGKVVYEGVEVPGHFEHVDPTASAENAMEGYEADIKFIPDDTATYKGFTKYYSKTTFNVHKATPVLADESKPPVVNGTVDAGVTLSTITISDGAMVNPYNADETYAKKATWKWSNPDTVVSKSGYYEAKFVAGSVRYVTLTQNIWVEVYKEIPLSVISELPIIETFNYNPSITWADVEIKGGKAVIENDDGTSTEINGVFSFSNEHLLNTVPSVGTFELDVVFTPENSEEALPCNFRIPVTVNPAPIKFVDENGNEVVPEITVDYGTEVGDYINLFKGFATNCNETLRFTLTDEVKNAVPTVGTHEYEVTAATFKTVGVTSKYEDTVLKFKVIVEPMELAVEFLTETGGQTNPNYYEIGVTSNVLSARPQGTFAIYVDGVLLKDGLKYHEKVEWPVAASKTYELKVVYTPVDNDPYIIEDYTSTIKKNLYWMFTSGKNVQGPSDLIACGTTVEISANLTSENFAGWKVTNAAGEEVDLGLDNTSVKATITMPDFDIHVEALEKNASSGGSGGLGDIDFGDLSEGDSEWAIINIIRNIIAMFKSFLQQLIETFQSIGD